MNVLEIALFIFYLFACLFAISKINFFRNSGLQFKLLGSIFLLKVIAGIGYAQFYKLPKYVDNADTWRLFNLSLEEKKWLLRNPIAFLKDLFIYGYSHSGNLFASENSYWNDLKSNVIIKILAIMNVFTFSSYYTNIILFNLLFLFGLVGLYRFMNQIFPAKKRPLIIGIFLIPSTLFWCSGIHKDGLLLSATGLLIYFFNEGLKNRFSLGKITAILFCLAFTFSLRNYTCLAIIPAMLAWALAQKFPQKTSLIFVSIYAFGILLFFLLPSIIPSLNFPAFLANKQHEFLLLTGDSIVINEKLIPTLQGYLNYLPLALDMAFFRPYISNITNAALLPAALEPLLFLALIVFYLFMKRKKDVIKPEFLFLMFFGLSILLITGYTITLSGAVVRYRSFAYPFIVTPLLFAIWPKPVGKVKF